MIWTFSLSCPYLTLSSLDRITKLSPLQDALRLSKLHEIIYNLICQSWRVWKVFNCRTFYHFVKCKVLFLITRQGQWNKGPALDSAACLSSRCRLGAPVSRWANPSFRLHHSKWSNSSSFNILRMPFIIRMIKQESKSAIKFYIFFTYYFFSNKKAIVIS